MKRFLAVAGLLSSLSLVNAHQSAVPHTHAFDRDHSDLFVVTVAALAVLTAVFGLYQALRRRKRSQRVRRS